MVVHLKGVFSPWKKDGELRHRKKVKETVFYEFRKDIAIDLTGFSFLIAQIFNTKRYLCVAASLQEISVSQLPNIIEKLVRKNSCGLAEILILEML